MLKLATITTTLIAISSVYADEQISELTDTSFRWDRMSSAGAEILGICDGVTADDSVNDMVPYAAFYIKVTQPFTTMDITVESLEANPIDFDPFIAVYCEEFDPLVPLDNLYVIDDDSAGYPDALAFVNNPLDESFLYIAVVSSYSNWAPSQFGEFKITLGPNLIFSPPCAADLNGDGALNFIDVSAFLDAYSMNDPIADFSDDGIINFFDIAAYLDLFNNGCP
jgi:hypothetical protein